MSFAIYGESDTYVHLVTADTRVDVLNMFLADLVEFGVKIQNVFNVYAVENNSEDKDLEDFIEKLIESAKNDQ